MFFMYYPAFVLYEHYFNIADRKNRNMVEIKQCLPISNSKKKLKIVNECKFEENYSYYKSCFNHQKDFNFQNNNVVEIYLVYTN